MKTSYLFLLVLLLFACDDDDTGNGDSDDQLEIDGLTLVESTLAYDATVSTVTNALEAAGPITVVAEVDHSGNAPVGLTLNNTSVVIFGNPALGTPLMQNNQLTGIDLPQKFLIFEDDSGITRVAYNDTEYLSSRHGLEGEATLTNIAGALNNFATLSGTEVIENETDVSLGEGITTKISANSFDVTYDQLFVAIDSNPNLNIVREVNHQQNAIDAGLTLEPTRLIVFGNPNLGTPLMQSNQTIGIDLPQKMLVWETEDGTVNVSYNNPDYLEDRHDLEGVDEQLNTIATALDNLSNAAIM